MSRKILIFIIAIILTFILLFCNSCNSSVEEPENSSPETEEKLIENIDSTSKPTMEATGSQNPTEDMDKINLMREDFDLGNCIVQHGFVPDKHQSMMIRVVISNEDLILCFRDSCKLFDIREKFDSVDQKDMTRNVGIRLVMRMAKDVGYINTLKINTTFIKI